MKKDLESSPKLSSEHSIEETKKEQETVHNQSEVAINNDSFDASKQSTNQKYFRCSLFTIEPEKQKEFIEQSDSFKKEVRKRLGGGILSAYMIQTERDKILLVGEYDSVENAVKGKIVADEIFLEMDAKFISSPIRTEEGRKVRKAFVPEKGYKLMAADYSQVELRIMAHLSGDPGLLTAFSSDQDIHKATAADVFNTPLNKVTADQRRSAKAINFGLIYGMSAFGLANQLNVSRSDAQQYVDRYFERYPNVRNYMDQTQALADEKGYVETIFGRRLYLPDIHAGNAMIRKAAQRTAINAPMQGSAADIIKRAMIDIDNWLALGELDARMLLQVHDEVLYQVRDDLLVEYAGRVKEIMESHFPAQGRMVQITAGAESGKRWSELSAVEGV